MKESGLFPTCRTDDGRVISAYEAKSSVMYRCFDTTCTCEVYKKIYPSRLETMTTRRGQIHTGEVCSRLVQRKYGRDLESTVRGGLEKGILRLPSQPRSDTAEDSDEKKDVKRPGKPRREGKPTRSITSLAELCQFGIDKMDNHVLFGDTYTVELFISQGNAKYVMGNHDDLGSRALEVSPVYPIDRIHTLRFEMCDEQNEKRCPITRKKYFNMFFRDEEEYRKAREIVFVSNPDELSSRRYLPRYEGTVLVFAIWEAIPYGDCRKKCPNRCNRADYQCYGAYEAQGINASTQIYVPRDRKQKNYG